MRRYRKLTLFAGGVVASILLATVGYFVIRQGERKIDIVVRASADARARAEQVPELIVHEAEERAVPLKAVAATRLVAGPSEIRRVGQRRAVVISGNLDGRDLGSVTADIDAVIAGLSLPSSVGTRFAGQQLEIEDSQPSSGRGDGP